MGLRVSFLFQNFPSHLPPKIAPLKKTKMILGVWGGNTSMTIYIRLTHIPFKKSGTFQKKTAIT